MRTQTVPIIFADPYPTFRWVHSDQNGPSSFSLTSSVTAAAYVSIVKLKHYDNLGHARFITFCTHRRIPLLTNNLFRSCVIRAIDEVRTERGFSLPAYVIMPDHVHMVIQPATDTSVGHLIGEIKYLSAGRIKSVLIEQQSDLLKRLCIQRNGIQRVAVWMRRCFDLNLRTEQSVLAAIEYCHNNPVRAGLRETPESFEWSSCRAYLGLGESLINIDRFSA